MFTKDIKEKTTVSPAELSNQTCEASRCPALNLSMSSTRGNVNCTNENFSRSECTYVFPPILITIGKKMTVSGLETQA